VIIERGHVEFHAGKPADDPVDLGDTLRISVSDAESGRATVGHIGKIDDFYSLHPNAAPVLHEFKHLDEGADTVKHPPFIPAGHDNGLAPHVQDISFLARVVPLHHEAPGSHHFIKGAIGPARDPDENHFPVFFNGRGRTDMERKSEKFFDLPLQEPYGR